MIRIDNPAIEIPPGYDLRKRIKMVPDEAGIGIPFPNRQIFMEKFDLDAVKPVPLED